METNKTRKLVTGGIMMALSIILSYIKIYRMPQGGSVTAGSMVPIILFALLYGLKDGLVIACVYGVIRFLLGGVVFHPASFIMDYLLGFGMMGWAGIFHKPYKDRKSALIGGFVGGFMRFVMLVLSGAIVWKAYVPEGMGVWEYSIGYNATYMIPEIIITVIMTGIIYDKVYDLVKF